MPWQETSTMSLRSEFVTLASQDDANVRELCRRFSISSRTAYKWLARYRADGASGLAEHSRRPQSSPGQTDPAMEQLVRRPGRRIRPGVAASSRPTWRRPAIQACRRPPPSRPFCGGTVRLIRRKLPNTGPGSASNGRQPNELWQMDFKGHFALGDGARCHPLTLLDDHARFLLALIACPNETRPTVQTQPDAPPFERYGLPERMLCDHGPPWGSPLPSSRTRP